MKVKFFVGVILASVMVFSVFISRAEEGDIIDNGKELFRQVQLLADSITLISTDYVKPVKVKDLVYGAIKGMMKTLDGYSQFLDPESFKEITEETKGEFGGLGIEVGMRDGVLTVIAPMEDTPAYEAGVEAGDRIVKIDDEVTRDMTLDEAVGKLRGEAGTAVTITVVREETEEMLDFKITRAIIKVKSIKDAEVIEEDIGYVRLIEFQERTAKDLRETIKKLRKEGAKSLIIDIRNNPGGLLDAGVEVADLFLKQGDMIVYTEGRDPKKRIDFKSKKEPDFDDMDIVVLVNKGSASAAEILAGALKDNRRALMLGVTTFGKASVQTVIPLEDKSALRLTTAAYFTPSGKNIMDKGVDPDVCVKRVKANEPEVKEEKEEKEEKKTGIFAKVEKPKKEKSEEKAKEYDNQIQAAVSILKGIRVFEEYRASDSAEGATVQQKKSD